jgi:hypothetical protein
MLTGGAGFVLEYAELVADTAKARAALQLNEDKVEDFSKWAEGVVRFVRVILDEADSTTAQQQERKGDCSLRLTAYLNRTGPGASQSR